MTTVSFPPRCAVAVVCGDHLFSQVYPAAVPIEAFLDNAVELISEDLRRRGGPELDPLASYELQRVNGTRLDSGRTLDDLGVDDGSTLVLASAGDGAAYIPHYESLSTGLAHAGRSLFTPVTAATAAHTAVGILGLVLATIVALAGRARSGDTGLTPALVTIALGILVAAGAFALWRWWPDQTALCSSLAWLAAPALAGGAAMAAPGPLGGAHVLIGCVAAGALGGVILKATGRTITLGWVWLTLCGIGALVAAARVWRPVPAQWLGMCALIGLLILLTAAPTIALRAARIRPPHFGSITGRDLFRRRDGMPADVVAPVEDESGDDLPVDDTPAGITIAQAAVRANAVLTGMCIAAAVALPAAVWAALMPGEPRATAAAVLASLFVVIFISRARSFTDQRQAVALVLGAAAAICAGVGRYVLHQQPPAQPALLWGAGVLVAFAAAGLAAGLLVPVTRFTPLIRMAVEWLELAAIVVALPLAAWIGGLFAWVRMR
jgi:type VII secretion integral membrane protein EccD